jgi:hypothetical protein
MLQFNIVIRDDKGDLDQIPDIEREDEFGMSVYCFLDDIGKISKKFAKEVFQFEKVLSGRP